MNGSMLAGTTVGLEHLLRSCLSRTTEDGVIIMDSTDLRLVGDLDEQVNQEFVGEFFHSKDLEL